MLCTVHGWFVVRIFQLHFPLGNYLLTRHGQFERLYVCTYGTCKLPKGYNSTVFILSELTCNKEEFTFSVYQRILW